MEFWNLSVDIIIIMLIAMPLTVWQTFLSLPTLLLMFYCTKVYAKRIYRMLGRITS